MTNVYQASGVHCAAKVNEENNGNADDCKTTRPKGSQSTKDLESEFKLTVDGLGAVAELRRSPLLLLTCRTGRLGGGRGCCGLCRPDTTCDQVGIAGLTGATAGTTGAGPEDSIFPTLLRLYLVELCWRALTASSELPCRAAAAATTGLLVGLTVACCGLEDT
jgi:hypothetical protein